MRNTLRFKMMKKTSSTLLAFMLMFFMSYGQKNLLWKIGEADKTSSGMALAPASYAQFLSQDFGWEDRYYLVGFSNPKTDFPYVLPGPKDAWGGTGLTSGIRSQILNVLFDLSSISKNGNYDLTINILGYHGALPPLFKVNVNGQSFEFQLPKKEADHVIDGDFKNAKATIINIPVASNLIRKGGNEIRLTTLEGAWMVFDQIKFAGPKNSMLQIPKKIFVRDIKAAEYEIKNNGLRFQPLLVDVQHLKGHPKLIVKLDGREIFTENLDSARYQFEVPMPAVIKARTSSYEILCDGVQIQRGKIDRSAKKLNTYADYVDTKLGSAHSRWMIAPGPWMPFGMVKLSPDNQDEGWTAGYDPTFESIGTFSHIHEWTMAGLGTMPTSGPLKIKVGGQRTKNEGYRSQIDKNSEKTPLGLYSVQLSDYKIKAEITSTTRGSFQRYTYQKTGTARVMIDLKIPAEYGYDLKEVSLKKVNDHKIEGSSKQFTKNAWSGGVNQEYTLYFVMEFDRPINKFGTWTNDQLSDMNIVESINPKNAGAYVEFDPKDKPVVQVRTGISLVSLDNAGENLATEITKPFGWSFDQVVSAQKDTWNNLLGRLEITSNDKREKVRFYSNMFRALASRNTWSDVDGRWVDASKKIQQLKNPADPAMGCDAFWNTFWNLNQFWNLAAPEWSSHWVKSQLAMYDANGWLAKGPAGMNYVPVMVAEHEIPLIVGAYQMGIRDYDTEKAFGAVYKMQTTPAQKVGKAGFAGNEDLVPYLKYKYVPYDLGRFSNTLEYAYDDWTVAQFAKSLGKNKEYNEFKLRSGYWKNVIDKETGYARLKKSDGTWFPDFDPFKSGANEHYVEGNAWQLTYFVPQDVPELAREIGVQRFVDRLSWGFGESYKLRFNAPGDQYWDYPVIQGNQQSMHFAFLFNWVKKPWLTQKWSRSIMDRFYGYGVANAYLGDEDQGQMSSWFIMNSLGLFQTDGGAGAKPIYEIGSPIFPKVLIHLNEQYGRGKEFIIEAKNVSRKNKYVQSVVLNGKKLDSFWFPAKLLLGGGKMVLEMGAEPNMNWGITNPPVAQ
jgi:predicted alpha-1,2-mannosidase